jgi:hypothetical protein
LSEVTFVYDHNLDDQEAGLSVGPIPYTNRVDQTQRVHFWTEAAVDGALRAKIDSFSRTWVPDPGLGDFNGNGVLDAEDIDLLSAEVRSGTNNETFDLNSDEQISDVDRTLWVERLKSTYFGDSNLDGQFDSRDLVAVFQAAKYEDAIDGNSGWATGDWNGDGDFSSRDLVLTFEFGGYEQGPRVVTAVPEPGRITMIMMLGLSGFMWRTVFRNAERRHGVARTPQLAYQSLVPPGQAAVGTKVALSN